MPGSPQQRLLIVLSFVAFISLGLPDSVLGVAWPYLRNDFALPISRLGWFLSFGVAGYLLSSFFAGALVRRLGVGRILLFSTVLVALSLLGYATTPRWELLLPLALCVGLGSGAIDAALNVFAAAAFSARVVNWLHAFYGVGATLGPVAMTAAVTTVVFAGAPGWRWGYAALAIAQGVTAIAFVATLRHWRSAGADGAAATADTPSPTTAQALRHPIVRLHILIYFVYAGTEVTAGQWLFSLLLESRSLPPAICGLAVTVFWASLTVGRIVFGQAAASMSPEALLRIATGAAPVAAVLLCIPVGGAVLALPAAALLGFALAPIYPMLIALTPARVGVFSPQSIGFQVSAATVGVAVLPSLAGGLARNLGLEVVPPFLVATTVLILVLNVWTARKAKGLADADRSAPAEPAVEPVAESASRPG